MTDTDTNFKLAVQQTVPLPIIVADRFQYCRYVHWAVDEVRRAVQKEWYAYDWKK